MESAISYVDDDGDGVTDESEVLCGSDPRDKKILPRSDCESIEYVGGGPTTELAEAEEEEEDEDEAPKRSARRSAEEDKGWFNLGYGWIAQIMVLVGALVIAARMRPVIENDAE